ncbi:hypothetical protein T484DRAFT_1862247 [Baffinella frigidus]|nr:hypothetical protein T484DRAFT_1862247 [Cryptophyta sp. CCMP2293]
MQAAFQLDESLFEPTAAFQLDESLFEPTVESLIKKGRLAGTLSGKGMRATFTPATFSKAQTAGEEG